MSASPQSIAIVALNLGGPDSPEAVEPFLRNLLGDPDVIQFGWLRFIQPLFARIIAHRRAPFTNSLYQQIGHYSPIREESQNQAQAVAELLRQKGYPTEGFVAMGCWHPFADETVSELKKRGIRRVVLLPLYPHRSRTTSGSAFRAFDKAAKSQGLDLVRVDGYATHPGYIDAVAATVTAAEANVPPEQRLTIPVLFSAHGLPVRYIDKGDRYLADIKATVSAVSTQLSLGNRTRLSFQSRLGRAQWLTPSTEEMLQTLGKEGHKTIILVPISFTGEHIETLHECDILYREVATTHGITTFVRARTVGISPIFIAALADCCEQAMKKIGWVTSFA
jgi:ferrochelatase